MYIRVRHFFWKIQFGGHFIALGQGISKLFLFFFWDLYFLNILTSKFGIPCSKVKKIFFWNIALWRFKRSALRHWTRISNHFSKIMKIDCTGSKKAVKFGNFPKSTVFRMSIEHFSTFLKIDSIFEFSVPIRVFWYVTRLYLKKIFFKLYYRGSQILKSNYSRNIRLRKKIKTVLKSPGRGL